MSSTQESSNLQFEVNQKQKAEQAPLLEESLSKLVKAGGFDFIEGLISGSDNLNPVRKGRREDFLKNSQKKTQRLELKKKLQVWLALLSENDTMPAMIEKGRERVEITEKLFKNNLKKVLDTSKELEQSYRSVHLFYKNTESPKLKNVVLMNASINQLTDLNTPRFIDFVDSELNQKFDQLDLRENYSLLVVPGYLKSNTVLDKWAKIAYKNKVMLFTDFLNIETPDDVLALFNDAKLTGGEPQKANVVMTSNYILARGKNDEVDEKEDVFVGGSAALAGKVYTTKLSQPVAGREFGVLDEIDKVHFQTTKAEISFLEDAGLVPLVDSWGRVMPFSAKTLFTGDNIGMKTYSVVRVFDFIAKVMSDFLNRKAFTLWTTKQEGKLRKQIVKFLDGIKGPDNLIEKFEIIRFERNEDTKDQIFLDIHITPFFPAKSFIVKLDGYKGDDAEEWKAQYQEQK